MKSSLDILLHQLELPCNLLVIASFRVVMTRRGKTGLTSAEGNLFRCY